LPQNHGWQAPRLRCSAVAGSCPLVRARCGDAVYEIGKI